MVGEIHNSGKYNKLVTYTNLGFHGLIPSNFGCSMFSLGTSFLWVFHPNIFHNSYKLEQAFFPLQFSDIKILAIFFFEVQNLENWVKFKN